MITHIIAELECAILGHINCINEDFKPVIVKYYWDGQEEQVADNICANCGHFITKYTRIRSQKFTPDWLKTNPPNWIKEKRKRWRSYDTLKKTP